MHDLGRRHVIRLSARLAVSGGRESIVRLLLTALGVAVGTTLLLFSAAADPAVRAQQQHKAWQYTGQDEADLRGTGHPLLWSLMQDKVDGRELVVARVAAAGPGAPVPLGLTHVPRPGEVYVSPALAQLIRDLPADRLADRFPSAPSGTIGPDHLAGPEDLVAVVGMPRAALEGQPYVRAVHHINTTPQAYGFTDFLRLVFAIGAVGLLLPVLVFVSTSTRLGAARREQRFAALRLAGATPRQTNVVAGVEAGAAAVVGAALGLLGFLLLRATAAGIPIDGQPGFVAEMRVAPILLAAILVAIPLLAVVAAMASLRRLQISPLGVARRAVRSRPTFRRLVPLVLGTVGFLACLPFSRSGSGPEIIIPVMGTFALLIYGIVVAGPWLTVLAARAIGRLGRRPAALLAGRRLEGDPASGFRAVSGLVLAVFVASVFSGVTPAFLHEGGTRRDGLIGGSTMAAGLPPGTSVATAEVALAAAAQAGAGPGIVLHSGPDDSRPVKGSTGPRPVTLLVACADLDVLDLQGPCPVGGSAEVVHTSTLSLRPSRYSAAELAGMPANTIVMATDGTPAMTDRVRTAIERAAPWAAPWLGSEQAAEGNRRLTQLTRLANLALALSLIIAGCGLAVAVAGGIIERQRPFALLRLSGMHLAELQQVAMLEAAAPLLLIALASAVLGLGISAVVVEVAGGIPWVLPSVGYWLSLAGGLVVALGVAGATLPLLGRTTAPSAVRFE